MFSSQAVDSQKDLSRMAVAGSLKTAWKTSGAKKSAIPLRGRESVAEVSMVLCSWKSECGISMVATCDIARKVMIVAKRATRIISIKGSATKDDVSKQFTDETSRVDIDNGWSRMGFELTL